MSGAISIVKESAQNPYRLNIEQIQKYLPHRQPFLLVDRILEIHPVGDLKDLSASTKVGIRVVGQKNVSFNEPFFQGHFPGYAIMPGVLVLEAMAQSACFSLYPYIEHDLERLSKDFQTILVGADSVRWRRPIVPGDVVRFESVVSKTRGKLWGFSCKAYVMEEGRGQIAAEAELLANLVSNSVQL